MTDYLYNGIYRLLGVEYDAKNGNHYFLKKREGGEIIHFHDVNKTMRYCPILDKARLEKRRLMVEFTWKFPIKEKLSIIILILTDIFLKKIKIKGNRIDLGTKERF